MNKFKFEAFDIVIFFIGLLSLGFGLISIFSIIYFLFYYITYVLAIIIVLCSIILSIKLIHFIYNYGDYILKEISEILYNKYDKEKLK